MSLLDPGLQMSIRDVVLPKLSAVSLSRLACTCRDLCTLVYSAGALPQWQAQARLLGGVHPASHSTSVPEILQALNQQARARANLKAGR